MKKKTKTMRNRNRTKIRNEVSKGERIEHVNQQRKFSGVSLNEEVNERGSKK